MSGKVRWLAWLSTFKKVWRKNKKIFVFFFLFLKVFKKQTAKPAKPAKPREDAWVFGCVYKTVNSQKSNSCFYHVLSQNLHTQPRGVN